MAENTNKPLIRFAGFTDAWEQRKLGEYLAESRIIGSNGLHANKLTVKLRSKGAVAKNDIGSEATQYYIRKSGQFIYGKLDFLNSAFAIVPPVLDGYESTLDVPAFDISDELNAKFLLEFVSQESFYLKHGNVANGSRKAKRIHADDFLQMPITKPTTVKEQAKIAELFINLDHLITLHQRERKKIQQARKYSAVRTTATNRLTGGNA
jgi:type I restriction enzyme S subunit